MTAAAHGAAQTTGSIARLVGGRLIGPDHIAITGVNSLDEAGPGEITFISDHAHARRWAHSRAAAAVISAPLASEAGEAPARALIVVPDAQLAAIELLQAFEPPPMLPDVGIHPGAWVHPSAKVARSARIGPQVTIDQEAVIGEAAVLFPGVRIYPQAHIGASTVIHANTVIRERCRVGAHVILHQNVSIGADGFGYRPSKDGLGLVKVPHLGIVVLEDHVEIGAGTCVDRAKFGVTHIGAGTKIDNLCQIAHNCRVGRACVIAGLTGLAGSVVLEDGVMVGGQVGVAEHVRVGLGARVGAKSGVMRDVPPRQTVLGHPAMPAAEMLRQIAALRRLSGLRKSGERPPHRGEHP